MLLDYNLLTPGLGEFLPEHSRQRIRPAAGDEMYPLRGSDEHSNINSSVGFRSGLLDELCPLRDFFSEELADLLR